MKLAVNNEHAPDSPVEAVVITDVEGDMHGDSVGDTHATAVIQETKSGGIAAGAEALGLDAKLLAAQIINFIILLLILRQFLYKPLVGLLEKRRRDIEESMKKVEEIDKRYADFQVEHEKRIQESKTEAAALIDNAKRAAEELRQESLTATNVETEKMLARGKEEIERQKEAALGELKHEVGSLVVAATGKIIGRELDAEAESKLIEEAVKEAKS